MANAMPGKRAHLILIALVLATSARLVMAERVELVVHCTKHVGAIRPLHGVNGGPIEDGGLLDLSAHHREAGFPLTRLHDVHWPNPDVVDMHAVFPDPHADPAKPESYDFAATDDYLRATLATGTKLVYRLGESIEHAPRKRHVHPPADAERWAGASVGIIRHYNEGWAGGFRHDIRYWEIWNEPDNRPNMWTGTDEDYFRLYAATAKRIKARWPHLKVGGPAVGNAGELVNGELRPSPFVAAFLERCRRDALPLDFFSWHAYTNDSRELAERAKGVRALLDAGGFRETESHLNEWNYLPDNDWRPVLREGQGAARKTFSERVGGAEGAAFVAASLMRLQDAPLDAANYFNAATGGFGLFDPHGVPRKPFHAMRAFKMLLDGGPRVNVSGAGDLAACAAADRIGESVTLMVSNESAEPRTVAVTVEDFPWQSPVALDVWTLDATHDLALTESLALQPTERRIERTLRGHAVCVIRLRRPAPAVAPPGR